MRFVFKIGFLAIALALIESAAFGAIVYQSNQVSNGGLNVSGNALDRIGDKVTLAGTDRLVTSVTIGTTYFPGGPAYTGSFTLTLFNDDGPVVSGITMPGTVIAASTTSAAYVSGQSQLLTFLYPLTLVPNTLHFQLQENTPQNNFQVQITGSGAIGSSASNFVIGRFNGNPNFQPFNVGGGNQVLSTITAVPEPSTIVMLGMGAIGLAVVARRKRS